MQDVPDHEVTINDELYYIEEATTGWSYCRERNEIDEDSAGKFKTHTDAIQAAMEHEKTRDELLSDIDFEHREQQERVAYHRGL